VAVEPSVKGGEAYVALVGTYSVKTASKLDSDECLCVHISLSRLVQEDTEDDHRTYNRHRSPGGVHQDVRHAPTRNSASYVCTHDYKDGQALFLSSASAPCLSCEPTL